MKLKQLFPKWLQFHQEKKSTEERQCFQHSLQHSQADEHHHQRARLGSQSEQTPRCQGLHC